MIRALAILILAVGSAFAQAPKPGPIVGGGGGGGATSGSAVPVWVKYTVPYTSLTAAATSQAVTLFTLPAQGSIQGMRIKHSTAFSGSGFTAATVSVGWSGSAIAYSPARDIFQATGATVMWDDGGNYAATSASHAVTATVTCNQALGNGSATSLSAGSVDIWILWSVLP